MRIAIIGSAHPLRGGLASFNERLASEFQNQGHQITIETFSLQYPGFLFPGKTQYSTSPAPKHLNINISINSINPFNWLKVGFKLKKEKYDLLIIKYWLPFMAPCFGTIGRIAKSNRHTRIITIIDNLIPHEKRPGDRILTQYYVAVSDAFVAMSKSVFNDINLFTQSKPRILSPHPIFDNFGEIRKREKALHNIGLSNEFRYILFFGFIRDYKGLDLLIDAFSDERFRMLPVKLLVAGEFYSDGQKYFDQIDKLKLSHQIILRNDFIANEQVADYFSAADIVAQPYKSATQSGVTQIGFHFEKPMLVTNVGGLAEIIPHEIIGYVTEPDPKEIANSLFDFFSSNRKDTFEQNIIQEKKKYDWKEMYQRIVELYQTIKP
jgi:D-inositol-3-phosphate glycosyltransferase